MRLGQPGVVAVVDDGGWPILIERMDHAAYDASVEVRAPDVAQPQQPLYAVRRDEWLDRPCSILIGLARLALADQPRVFYLKESMTWNYTIGLVLLERIRLAASRAYCCSAT